MPTPPSDETKLLFQMLTEEQGRTEDGKWYLYETVRDRLAFAIPPGKALRRYEQNLDYKRRYRGEDNYDTALTEDDRIFYGQRMLAQAAITGWKGRAIDFRGDGRQEPKLIRLKPGFKTWGVDVEAPEYAVSDEESDLEKAVEADVNQEIKSPEEVVEPGSNEVVEPPPVSVPESDERPEDYSYGVLEDSPVLGPPGDRAMSFEDRVEAFEAEQVRQDPVPRPFVDSCAECGLYVSDPEKHEDFHMTHPPQKSSDGLALLDRNELRHLIEEVVSEQLDQFQGGMTTYLQSQFQQLEGLISIALGMPWRASVRPKKPAY